ncbi:MAG: YaiO family outer membrane beta-barrel protein [Panacagrimonas sp.]
MEDRALTAWGARRFDEAIVLWEELIAAAPGQRRYRLGLVRTLVTAGNTERARTELQAAKAVPATAKSDAYNTLVAEGELLRAERRDKAADLAFQAAADLSGRNLRRASPPGRRDDARPWRLNVGGSADHFDNERGWENQLQFELGYRFSSDLQAYGVYEQHHRFEAVDDSFLVGVATILFDALGVRMDIGGTPEAEFRPRTEGSVRLDWLGLDFVQPQLAYQVLDYSSGQVSTLTPGVRLFPSSATVLDLQYSFTTEVDGSDTRIGGVRLGWKLGQRWRPTLSYYRGEEALPPQMRADFQRAGAGMTWVASREWQLRGDYAYEDRENAYVAHSLAVGIGVNF